MVKMRIVSWKIVLSFLLLLFTTHVRSQEYFEMKCIGIDVYNADSTKVANEYLGKIVKISNDVKSPYYSNKQKQYTTIGNRNYQRHSQTSFEWRGVDYWIVYDRASFAKDYSCLKVTIHRPLTHSTGVGAKSSIITLYYVTDVTAESQPNINELKNYTATCPKCKGTGKIKPNRHSQHPDECVGICGRCHGYGKIIKQFNIR